MMRESPQVKQYLYWSWCGVKTSTSEGWGFQSLRAHLRARQVIHEGAGSRVKLGFLCPPLLWVMAGGGHASVVESQSQHRETRRQEIADRIAAIRTRIDELQQAQREDRHPVSSSEQFGQAEHHAAISEATAQQALDAGIEAFLHAAQAHERAAIQHEYTAAAGSGDAGQHHERAAFHRAAAAADRQRAETAQSLIPGHHPGTAGKREDG
jgi:hypothetical protein